ncbi:MAG: hypothetical protein AB1665_09190 [Candidatus Thermoplasmatota archaeon]
MFQPTMEQLALLGVIAILLVGITFAWLAYQLVRLQNELKRLREVPAPAQPQAPPQPPQE